VLGLEEVIVAQGGESAFEAGDTFDVATRYMLSIHPEVLMRCVARQLQSGHAGAIAFSLRQQDKLGVYWLIN
jgi:hypothetical protein